jgi:hypothetical protein
VKPWLATPRTTCKIHPRRRRRRHPRERVETARQFEGINCAPIADAQIPTPLVGVTIYFSSDLPGMAKKDTAGNVTAL